MIKLKRFGKDEMMRLLIATVGLPRSGKTTWAKAFGKTHNIPIVNPDSIRLGLHGHKFLPIMEPYVWTIAKTMVRALFEYGYEEIILDATNITVQRRKEWLSKDWETRFITFPTNTYVCIKRATEAGDQDMIPIIERMAAQYEPLTPEEVRF